MKKKILLAILVSILLSPVITVLAAYSMSILISNTTDTAYLMTSGNISANIDYMATNFIFANSDGLDTRIVKGTQNQEFMLVDDRIMLATAVPATSSQTLYMTTSNSLLSSFPIIPGNGGSIAFSDAANIELGDNFTAYFSDILALQVSLTYSIF